MSGRVNLVAPASPIECLLNLPNVRAIQYKLGPERLTRLGNSNTRLPVAYYYLNGRSLEIEPELMKSDPALILYSQKL